MKGPRSARESRVKNARAPDLSGPGSRGALLRRGRDGRSGGQPEARVALRRDLVALAFVDQEATDVGHEHARLTWDVGADIPGTGLRIRSEEHTSELQS